MLNDHQTCDYLLEFLFFVTDLKQPPTSDLLGELGRLET